eukprot:TRINITY_DN46653_c0_g1_i1.p2 TRINITY_DN46653_c0_g1~~TRINITY_DN46653_c0_g1_i1.p2  ORF type:complete len:544 (-),score=45.90 TRINITY_DN46653_c0_g1_i1:2163-3794(-)
MASCADTSLHALISRLGHSSDRDIRDSALDALTDTLCSVPADPSTYRKIWRGLWFCVWHADKPAYYRALADRIAALLTVIPSTDEKDHSGLCPRASWLAAMIRIFSAQWTGVDQHRINKYLLILRRVVRFALAHWKPSFAHLFRCTLLLVEPAEQIAAATQSRHVAAEADQRPKSRRSDTKRSAFDAVDTASFGGTSSLVSREAPAIAVGIAHQLIDVAVTESDAVAAVGTADVDVEEACAKPDTGRGKASKMAKKPRPWEAAGAAAAGLEGAAGSVFVWDVIVAAAAHGLPPTLRKRIRHQVLLPLARRWVSAAGADTLRTASGHASLSASERLRAVALADDTAEEARADLLEAADTADPAFADSDSAPELPGPSSGRARSSVALAGDLIAAGLVGHSGGAATAAAARVRDRVDVRPHEGCAGHGLPSHPSESRIAYGSGAAGKKLPKWLRGVEKKIALATGQSRAQQVLKGRERRQAKVRMQKDKKKSKLLQASEAGDASGQGKAGSRKAAKKAMRKVRLLGPRSNVGRGSRAGKPRAQRV